MVQASGGGDYWGEYGECSRAHVLTVDMITDSTTHFTHISYRQENDRECSTATLITECNMPLTVYRTL